MGFYIGITGWVCDERRGLELQEVVKFIPLDKLMIETDAPFLIPRTKKDIPLLKPVTRNEPCLLFLVLEMLSKCLNIPPSELAQITTQNAKTFFFRKVKYLFFFL